jgi:hypothetical protein
MNTDKSKALETSLLCPLAIGNQSFRAHTGYTTLLWSF